ncbi:MAG: condensation domain-containing protein, partial [Flavobacterium sp.]
MGDLILKQRLTQLIQQGITFEASEGKLLIKGDLSVLSPEHKDFLKENKNEIIALIEQTTHEIPLLKSTEKNTLKPLSFSQQSLWLLDKINNGSSHYNLTSTFKLKGKLDYKALNQTFNTILERHDSLRSVFFVDNLGEPVQKNQALHDFTIAIEELDVSIENRQDQILQKIEEETNKIFDLTKDLLLSVRLFKANDLEYFMIVTMHHIASDGWSIGVLVKEFNSLYNSYSRGEPNALPDLQVQYSDYANWQRQWLKGKVLENQINYWKKQLADLPVIHNLPLDKTRPFIQSFNGNTFNSHIDKNTLTALYNFCNAESAT